jgi:hypothetical protein
LARNFRGCTGFCSLWSYCRFCARETRSRLSKKIAALPSFAVPICHFVVFVISMVPIVSIDITYWNCLRRISIIRGLLFRVCIGLGSIAETAGEVVDLKIIRMAGIPLLVVIGLAVLVPRQTFAQG